jgi:CRP/FNR family transcriptional regulator
VADDGSTRLIEILGPGQWLGVAAVAGQATYQARAVAVTAATLTQVGIDQFRAALLRRPEQLLELSRQLAGRLLAANEEAARLVFEDCNQRLLRTLVRFSRSAASAPCEQGVVLRMTHDQLAQAIGVARETVSLALTQLRQQNLLKTGRNQLVFDPEALARLAEQSSRRQPRERPAAMEQFARAGG